MKDWAQSQVALAGPKGVFDFRQLDIPTPKLAGIFFGAVGAQQIGAMGGLRPFGFARVFADAQSDRA
ncbi:hypothetical protein, partial [Chthoniobacter flavus]|uniref:hypothetical protein n=1 Tax=Chthoniobacter flavus TaxID=191863 RepID=UPI001ED8F3A4